MYKSPIDVMIADIQHQIAQQQDEQIYKAVVHIGVNVDKAELIRALQYDRNQYEKGYADGKVDAMAELVRCKDCKHYMEYPLNKVDKRMCCYVHLLTPHFTPEDGFCSYGERRTDDA